MIRNAGSILDYRNVRTTIQLLGSDDSIKENVTSPTNKIDMLNYKVNP